MNVSYEYHLELQISRADGVYSIGDTVKIFPVVFANRYIRASGIIQWELTERESNKVTTGSVELGVPGAAIYFKAEKPASYLCQARFKPSNNDDEIKVTIGFIIEPEKLTYSWQIPADFDDFWEKQKQRLAEIPLRPELVPIKSEGCNAFDIKVPCVDNVPVSGLFITPENSTPGSCPAVISLHGAGVQGAIFNSIMPFVSKGYIALDINAHGLPNLQKPDFYNKIAEKELADYRVRDFCDERPDNIYFINMFLRVKRAIEFMVTRAEWDGRNIFLVGTSQGGFQAIAGAYLDDRITAIAAAVPAGSNILDGGWPSAAGLTDLKDENIVFLKKNIPYVDNISFASRLEIPVALTVGLIDCTCPANGIFSVYNACKGEKVIFAGPEIEHAKELGAWNQCIEFIEKQLI